MSVFDDTRLDDPDALATVDPTLRRLAEAGRRVRIEHDSAGAALAGLQSGDRPRAVVAAGPEARLIRALLEPVCPVPFVAWSASGLPGWVGPLDLVVLLAAEQAPAELVATAREAVRRGTWVVVACGDTSPLVDHAASSATTFLTMRTGDNLAAVTVMMSALHRLGLGPDADPARVADTLDEVATRCSPHADVAANPAKDFALCTADAQVLLWGGSTLAARASRRIAEALRAVTGRPALAADGPALLPVLESVTGRDLFADPFLDDPQPRPVLVVTDDRLDESWVRTARGELVATAERHDVRVVEVVADAGDDLQRYAALLQQGRYGATYLALGLGRQPVV